MARPTKLTPEISESLLNFIKMGLPIKRAANCAGISEATYYNWQKLGKDGEPEFLEFLESLEQAEGEAQAVLVQKLQKDDEPANWKFILERRWPKEWGRKDRFEHSGPDGGAIEFTWPKVNADSPPS